MNLLYYIVGMWGGWFIADGISSLWAYLPRADETFWRNHSFRIIRSIGGIFIVVAMGYLIYLDL